MQIEAISFRKGAFYKIKNRKTQNYLSVKMNQIDSTSHREQENNAWIIEQAQIGQFQIVDMKSAKTISFWEPTHSLKLQTVKSKDTNWVIEQADEQKQVGYYWIKPLKDKGLSLRASSLSSKIKVDSIDQTLDITLWQFIQYDLTGEEYKGLSSIQSLTTKLVLEVAQYSLKEGASIIQAHFRGYGSQRWIIERSDAESEQLKFYIIRNFYSRLILTAQYSKFHNRITQQPFNNSTNQKWNLQQIDPKTFLIQSISNKLFYLAVSSEKEGSQAILTHQGHKTSWIIEGFNELIHI